MSQGNHAMTFEQWYEGGLRMAQGICGIVTAPLESVLRPCYGTRYFNPLQLIFTILMMLMLPVASKVSSQFPGGSRGLIGLGTLSALFFLGQLVHAPRLWRRIFNMELERHSESEGPALPFFHALPYGDNFWIVRIFYEPLGVMFLALMLYGFHLTDAPTSVFLFVSAVLLAVKNYLCWHQQWNYFRTLMDQRNVAPLMVKAATGKATEGELAQVHLAGFERSVPKEVRVAAIAQRAPQAPALPPEIARLMSAVEPVAESVVQGAA